MKLSVHSTPVRRASSLRSQPYDLRRRVLVRNFLSEQHSPSNVHNRPPTPRIPHQLQAAQTQSLTTLSEFRTQVKSECKRRLSTCEVAGDSKDPNALMKISKNNGNSSNENFLYLFSRRLRSTETSGLRHPCRRSKLSTTLRSSKMRLSESREKLVSQSRSPLKKDVFKATRSNLRATPKMTPPKYALRSYPTFDKLNEIVSCDSATYKKTIEALRSGSTRSTFATPENTTKLKRSLSIRQSLTKLLKIKSSTNVLFPSTEIAKSQTDKANKKISLVSKLFSPFVNEKPKPEECAPARTTAITRSSSFRTPPTPGAPKLKRRAQSLRLRVVKLGNDAF